MTILYKTATHACSVTEICFLRMYRIFILVKVIPVSRLFTLIFPCVETWKRLAVASVCQSAGTSCLPLSVSPSHLDFSCKLHFALIACDKLTSCIVSSIMLQWSFCMLIWFLSRALDNSMISLPFSIKLLYIWNIKSTEKMCGFSVSGASLVAPPPPVI